MLKRIAGGLTAAVAAVLGGLLALVLVATTLPQSTAPAAAQTCRLTAVGGDAGEQTSASTLGIDSKQLTNARTIARAAAAQQLGRRALVTALATSLHEAHLRNLPRGHLDSVGLFQQRPSQGWGSRNQILQPRYAARQFFQRLKQVPNRRQLPPTVAAEAVQNGPPPHLYADNMPKARRIADAVLSGQGITCTAQQLSDLGQPCQTSDMVTIQAGGQHLTVNRQLAATFTRLINQFNAQVENVETAGGYACRANVNSPDNMSRHAYGAAVDLNAAQHPNGASGTFSPAQERAIRAILRAHPNIRWGGDYQSTTDEMHFELHSGNV